MRHEITETCSCGAQYHREAEWDDKVTITNSNARITVMQQDVVKWRAEHRHEFKPEPAVKDDGTRDPKAYDNTGGTFGFSSPHDSWSVYGAPVPVESRVSE